MSDFLRSGGLPPVRVAEQPATHPKGTAEVPEIIFDVHGNRTYQRGRFLGKGGFARCYEVTDTKTKAIYACKIVDKSLLTKTHQREKMAQEIAIHRELKHDFIVGFRTYFEDDLNVYIILEYCAKKSLMELQKRRKVLTETEARFFLRQLLEAVTYLHERSTIHRDLKLGNIFISDDMSLRVGDFGLATTVEHEGERKRTLCGTPNYIAPEVLSKKGHSFEVDMWSIGCIFYTLLIGKPPFETATLKDTYGKIKRGEYTIPLTKVSAAARTLIQKLLQVEPDRRPSAKELLSSDYLTKNYIPTALPVSCLTMPPRFDQRKSNPVAKRPLLEHNPRSPIASAPLTVPTKNNEEIKSPTGSDMRSLYKQLKFVLDNATKVVRKSTDDDAEDPASAPMLYVSKWVDYSDKYGFGYQLSDDSIGVSFNDTSRMTLLGDNNHLQYVDKNGIESQFTKTKPPHDLAKKIKLLNYFQQYMNENLLRAGAATLTAETAEATRLPNMWTWFRTSRSVVMVLTNGTVQINNFRDHNKMILCPHMAALTTLDHNQPIRTFSFSKLSKGCTADMLEKLRYVLEKMDVIVNSPKMKPVALGNQNTACTA